MVAVSLVLIERYNSFIHYVGSRAVGVSPLGDFASPTIAFVDLIRESLTYTNLFHQKGSLPFALH